MLREHEQRCGRCPRIAQRRDDAIEQRRLIAHRLSVRACGVRDAVQVPGRVELRQLRDDEACRTVESDEQGLLAPQVVRVGLGALQVLVLRQGRGHRAIPLEGLERRSKEVNVPGRAHEGSGHLQLLHHLEDRRELLIRRAAMGQRGNQQKAIKRPSRGHERHSLDPEGRDCQAARGSRP